jgi:hypothetical protein
MRKKKTILWLGILLLLLIGAGWAWHLYDKPHRSTADETPDLTISADSLYHQYQSDEKAADQKYMGKVISITGRLTDIQHSGKADIWILSAQPDGGGVNCQLFAGTKPDPGPRPGDAVTVKGRCTGFLMDVNMVDCVPER